MRLDFDSAPLVTVLLARDAPALAWPPMGHGPRGDLPDAHVWLALATREHPRHRRALRYWEELESRQMHDARAGGEPCIWFSRDTMLEFLRLLCESVAAGGAGLALPQALARLRRFRSIPDVGMLGEQPTVDAHFQALVHAHALAWRALPDIWLAAQARAAGLRLVTFEPGLRGLYPEKCLVLGEGEGP